MKKFLKAIVFPLILIICVYSLYTEGYLDYTPLYDIIYFATHIKEEKIPSPIAQGSRISFYGSENIAAECDGSVIRISGVTNDAKKRNMIFRIKESDREIAQEMIKTRVGTPFDASVKIPSDASESIELSVFTNSESYGTFDGWVSDYLYFDRGANGDWHKRVPMVYAHNEQMFSEPKPSGAALKGTRNVEADNPSVRAAAERVTAECESDYEKALAIHDYICTELYYDNDMASREIISIESAADILASKRGVCSGYANAYAAMCRSIGLPCVVVTGYAIGFGAAETEWTEQTAAAENANHAWNEVYADGRWLIVDTTWDCRNSYRNGHIEDEGEPNHIYFDANLEYFSVNHKILRYKDI